MSDQVLLDFLYSDHERVASFLAQLVGYGAPKTLEKAGAKARTQRGKAGLDTWVGKAEIEGDRNWKLELRDTYDPLWVNSRRLIEEVNWRQKERPLGSPRVGQLRILSGTLMCFDYSLVTSLMSADAFEDMIAAGVNDSDIIGQGKNKFREKKKTASVIRGFLQSLPLGIGFVLVSEHGHYWFSVKREFLNLHELDIPLKFPIHISGSWDVLAVVDALPNDHVEGIQRVIDRQIDGLMPPMVLNFMQMTGTMTSQFGRPMEAGGLSPLAVYRDVYAQPTEEAQY